MMVTSLHLAAADPRRRIGRVIVKMIFMYCNSIRSIPQIMKNIFRNRQHGRLGIEFGE